MSGMRKRLLSVTTAVVLLVVGLGVGVRVHGDHIAREARIREATKRRDDVKALQTQVADIARRTNAAFAAYNIAQHDATAAGNIRHDSTSDTEEYAQAKREQTDLAKMSANFADAEAACSDEIDAFERRYASSTAPIRATLRSLELSRLEEDRTWSEAIDEIADILHATVNGQDYDGSNSAHQDYDRADAAAERAQVEQEALYREFKRSMCDSMGT